MIVVHVTYFLRMSYDIPDSRLKLLFAERSEYLFIPCTISTPECFISAEFRTLNGLSLEPLIGLISPVNLRIMPHPVNLDIYIDSLVHYSWGVVDFNPFQSFFN